MLKKEVKVIANLANISLKNAKEIRELDEFCISIECKKDKRTVADSPL